MKNITYFLKKFGNKSFDEFPFNEVDSLILCQLAYLNYNHIVPLFEENKDPVRYVDILIDDLVIIKMCENTLDERYNRQFLRILRSKKRYRDVFVNDYRNIFEPSQSKQFSAITFFFNDLMFIAYQGTGPTLVGWKEDFNMAVLDEIPAQEEALQYLYDITSKYDKKFYMGGHSKGGNLVSFAALNASEDVQKRIIHVYNHDGPGFKKSINENPRFALIEPIFTKYIPEDSMVGLLLHHTDQYSVIECYGMSIIQHDPYLWKINKSGHFKLIENGSFRYRVFEKANREWIDSISAEDRSRFIDLAFDLIGVSGNIGILDIKKHPIAFSRSLKRRYLLLSNEDHQFMRDILKRYPKISKRIRKELRKK